MLDPKTTQADPVQEVRQVQQEKKKKHLGSIIPHRGHIVFEVNLKEHTIVPATYEEETVSFEVQISKPKSQGIGIMQFEDGTKKIMLDKLPNRTKTLIRKENCTYIPALNKRNVIKKLVKKGIIQIIVEKQSNESI